MTFFEKIKNNIFIIILTTLLDVLFLFAFGYFTSSTRDNIGDISVQIGLRITELLKQGTYISLLDMLLSPGVQQLFFQLLFFLVILGLLTYLIYCIFQGSVWYLILSIFQKLKWVNYVKKFFLINLLWFLLFCTFYTLYVIAEMRTVIVENITGSSQFSLFSIVLYIFLFLIIYFALISYVTGKIKNTFKIGKKHWKKFVIMYLVLLGGFTVVNILLFFIHYISFELMMFAGIVLLPLFSLARIYVIMVVKNVLQ